MLPSLPVILASLQYMHPAHRGQVLQRCTEDELRHLLAEASRNLDKNLLQAILLRILSLHEPSLQVPPAQHHVQGPHTHHNALAPPPQQHPIYHMQHLQHPQHLQSGLPMDQPVMPVRPQTTQASVVGYHGPHPGCSTDPAPSQNIEGFRGPFGQQVLNTEEAQVGAQSPPVIQVQPPLSKPSSPGHKKVLEDSQIREKSSLSPERPSNNESRLQTPAINASGTTGTLRAPTTPVLEVSIDKNSVSDSPISVNSEDSIIHVVAKPKEQPTGEDVRPPLIQPRFGAPKRALATDSHQEDAQLSKRVRQESSDLSSPPPEFDRDSAAYGSEGVQQVCESTENNDKSAKESPETKMTQRDEMLDMSDDSSRKEASPDLIDADASSPEHEDSDNDASDSDTCSVYSDYSIFEAPATPPSRSASRCTPRAFPRPIDDPDSIDWVLYTPSMNEFSPLHILPAPVRTELMFRFVGTYRVNDFKFRKQCYERLVRRENQDAHASSKTCLNFTLFKRKKEMTFQFEHDRRACDYCIKMRRLCARIIKDDADGTYKLGFFPLPEGLRKDVMWDNIAFWVQLGGIGRKAKKSQSNRKFVRKR